MESAFLQFLNRFGKDVTIIHRAPKMVEGVVQKNIAGETIYETPVEISTKCRFIKKNEYEKTSNVGKMKVQGSYVIGMFTKDDSAYLEEDNQVVYEDPKSGRISKYDMKDITETEGHYEVILV